MFYVPVGISHFGKKNFQNSVDIGPMFSDALAVPENDANPLFWSGHKAGYRFGPVIDVLKSGKKTSNQNIVSLSLGNNGIYPGLFYERLQKPFLSVEAGLGFWEFQPEQRFIFHLYALVL